jgi:putative addiction module component (TIGR02574 family)
MSVAEIIEKIRALPPEERREVVERIGNEFLEFDDELSPEQITELERRAAELRKNPEAGIPWETVQAELMDRLKRRPA